MPMLSLPINFSEYHIEKLFSLNVTQKMRSTKIVMQTHHKYVNTGYIPSVERLLRKHLPTVLLTECYNDDNLPFAREVKSTEIGHLFEHILLEYLCQLKIAKGSDSAAFSGRTSWNWIRDPRGKFHIRLSLGKNDADILPEGLEKTIKLMKIIFETTETKILPIHKPVTPSGLKNGKTPRTKTR